MITAHKKDRYIAAVVTALVLAAILCRWVARATDGWINVLSSQLRSYIYIGLYAAWGLSLYQRITHKQTRSLLMGIAALAVLWMSLRTAKYYYVDGVIATRYLWYAYYIPMNTMPTLCALVALSIGKPEAWRLPKWAFVVLAVPLLLALGVMANDFHQLAFRFLTPVWNENDIVYGPVYWASTGWSALCAVAGLITLFRKCRLPHSKRFLMLPFIPAGISILYWLGYVAQIPVLLVLAGDVTAFQCLFFSATMESCIQCGLIRSNSRYDELFCATSLRALITDKDYKVVFRSQNAEALPAELMRQAQAAPITQEGLRISSASIRGGHVLWQEDVAELLDVLADLEDVSEYLEGKRKTVQKELETGREQQRLAEKNRLYNKLMNRTNEQIVLYGQLAERLEKSADPQEIRQLSARIAVVSAYLKRQDNLIFLDEEKDAIAPCELEFCIRESLNAISLCGVSCRYSSALENAVLFEQISLLYEIFHSIVMKVLDTLSSLYVFLIEKDGDPAVTMRMVCGGLPDLGGGEYEIEGEDDEWAITFAAPKGGNAQ